MELGSYGLCNFNSDLTQGKLKSSHCVCWEDFEYPEDIPLRTFTAMKTSISQLLRNAFNQTFTAKPRDIHSQFHIHLIWHVRITKLIVKSSWCEKFYTASFFHFFCLPSFRTEKLSVAHGWPEEERFSDGKESIQDNCQMGKKLALIKNSNS